MFRLLSKRQLAVFFLASAASLAAQRVDNHTLALPHSLPTGDYQLEEAFRFDSALAIASPPGEANQLFFAERSGAIRAVSDLAAQTIEAEPFLDLSQNVTTHSENGLLGLAFHPNYSQNREFYVFYTTNESGQSTNRLSRFLRSDDNPLRADPASERILIDQRDEAGNHNGGDIHFGPDGYLYVALGDEGGGNDSYDNSQRVDRDFFAGLLRLDVDKRPGSIAPTNHSAIPRDDDGEAAYSVPADNPLVPIWQDDGSDSSSDLRLEFYAIGLRNPWRFSFDSATGQLWLADVGQGRREEINLIEKGGNYGWAFREGTLSGPKSQTPPAGFESVVNPIHEYGRNLGYSVTGGVVYRGSRLPELYGAYVFGDYGSGRIFALFPGASGEAPTVTEIASSPGHFEYGIDPSNGDILVSGTGAVRRIVRGAGSAGPDFPATLSETGAFRELATLEPEAGIYLYEPNVAFWSDHARKSRWFSIPEGEQIEYLGDQPWRFPQGSVFIKHFELEKERGNPASRLRVETRFLVKTDSGAYGLSYRWNEEQTDAELVPAEGATIPYELSVDGQIVTQDWRIPARQDCLSCHTEAAGYVLSFNTRQLNRSFSFDQEEEANILRYFSEIGIIDTEIAEPEALPRHFAADDTSATLEQRARSYLAVNCVSCHQPGASAPDTWDARPELDLAATGLINGRALNDGGNPNRRLVVRGAPERSILIDRVAGRNAFSRMPPIATNVVDEQGVELLSEWIGLTLPPDLSFDEWQTAHFGSPDTLEAVSTSDPDRDGNSNRLEFLNRTLPLDPGSVWRPALEADGDSLFIRFPMAPGREFTVESSEDLAEWEPWPVPGNPPTADNLETIDAEILGPLPENGEPRFLRVKVAE